MTESQIRAKVVDIMRGWLGGTMGSSIHRDILAIYNAYRPLPRGYTIKVSDAYCAVTVSAAWIKAGCASIAPIECSVPYMVDIARNKGVWVESDSYVPKPGDAIVYDWDDGSGYADYDNHNSPDHVGMVERVEDGLITAIEGNMGNGYVGRRRTPVNGRYIRGFICPKYSTLATEEDKPNTNREDVCKVEFPVLREGSRSGYVKTAQILLNYYYGSGIAVDGIFGPATERAVMNFQKRENLVVDGIIGEKSWVALAR